MDSLRLISVKEAAEILRMRPNTLYKWAREGKIPKYRVGRSVRFKAADVKALVERVK